MDADLTKKFAPRRNRRHQHIREFNDEAEWADGLDWKDNGYDFYRLFRAVLDRLDLEYREGAGLRLSQLATLDELLELVRMYCAHYRSEERRHQILGIYCYLLVTIPIDLSERKRWVLDQRRGR